MAGSKTSSQGITLAHFAKEAHVDVEEAQGIDDFALQSLSKQAQEQSHGLPRWQSVDWQQLLTDYGPRRFLGML
ncbi:hypothetical protein Tco_0530822 [Tanacetum coccineum]